jgi:hypothetical protein
MNLLSPISNEPEAHHMTYERTMTAAVSLIFLERLLADSTRKVFLLVDRLPVHEAKSLAGRVADRADRIDLFSYRRTPPNGIRMST